MINDTIGGQTRESHVRAMMLEAQIMKGAAQQQHHQKILAGWAEIRKLYPDRPVAYIDGALAYISASQADLAEALMATALERFPSNEVVFARYTEVALLRRDWDEALKRCKIGRGKYPSNTIFEKGEARARFEISHDWSEDPLNLIEAENTAPSADVSAKLSNRELMLRFEGIGSNCDFGMVQRHFGAEPLGLLRFASVPLDRLLNVLADRFEGVGEPENTTFAVRPYPRPEYWTSDKRYDLLSHTFIYPQDMTEQQEKTHFRKQCKRLQFLREKLILDLKSAEKTLVYQLSSGISREKMQELFASLRQYGSNALLCVVPESKEHAAGSVEVLDDPALLVGYIKTFPHREEPLDVSNWLEVTQNAQEALRYRI